jgi:5-methylcytosine-specific restriction endonuclease McrA
MVERRGKRFSVTLNPDYVVTASRRITGKVRRKLIADYLIKRDGNRCALSTPGHCQMNGQPFEHPESANFDHIKLADPPIQRLGNLRLTCDNCNKHQLALQWKSYRAVSSAHEREKENTPRASAPAPTSAETASSYRMHPRTVELLFHPLRGRLASLGSTAFKTYITGNLPEWVKEGRQPTYERYIGEFVQQGYLTLTGRGDQAKLTRTGKDARLLFEIDGLTWPEAKVKSRPLMVAKEEQA